MKGALFAFQESLHSLCIINLQSGLFHTKHCDFEISDWTLTADLLAIQAIQVRSGNRSPTTTLYLTDPYEPNSVFTRTDLEDDVMCLTADKHLIAFASGEGDAVLFNTLDSSQRRFQIFSIKARLDFEFSRSEPLWCSSLLDAETHRFYDFMHWAGTIAGRRVFELQITRISFPDDGEEVYEYGSFVYELAPDNYGVSGDNEMSRTTFRPAGRQHEWIIDAFNDQDSTNHSVLIKLGDEELSMWQIGYMGAAAAFWKGTYYTKHENRRDISAHNVGSAAMRGQIHGRMAPQLWHDILVNDSFLVHFQLDTKTAMPASITAYVFDRASTICPVKELVRSTKVEAGKQDAFCTYMELSAGLDVGHSASCAWKGRDTLSPERNRSGYYVDIKYWSEYFITRDPEDEYWDTTGVHWADGPPKQPYGEDDGRSDLS